MLVFELHGIDDDNFNIRKREKKKHKEKRDRNQKKKLATVVGWSSDVVKCYWPLLKIALAKSQ